MKKRFMSMLLVLCLITALIPAIEISSDAASYDTSGIEGRIQQIMEVLPDQTMFTDEDGDSTVQDVVKAKSLTAFTGGHSFADANTCVGFAHFLAYALYGTEATAKDTLYTQTTDPVIGDFVYHYKADGSFHHIGLFLGWIDQNAGIMRIYDCNGNADAYYKNEDHDSEPVFYQSPKNGEHVYRTAEIRAGRYNNRYSSTSGSIKFYHLKDYERFNKKYKRDFCSHSYSPDGFGFCPKCGSYDPQKDVRSTGIQTYWNPKLYTLNCACRVRLGPYEECDSPDGEKTPKGTRFTVVGELINGRNNLWYKTSDGRYIYGEWADYAGEDNSVSFGKVSGSVTDTNAILKTTVYKKRGADAQAYGVAIIGFPQNKLFVTPLFKTAEFPDTYVANSSESYAFTLDLTKEAGWTLPSEYTFYASMFVVVDGARYSSKWVKFETSSGGLFVSDPILDADTVRQIEAAGLDLSAGSAAESSGAITWNNASVSNVTSTTALVKYTLTPNKSMISRIGMQYCTDGSSFANVPGCEWAGSLLTSFCSVAFDGSEGPRLSPGTTYYCRFYIIRTDGGTEYSPVITFTTNGADIREYTVSLNVNRDDGAMTGSTEVLVSTGGCFGPLPMPFSACAVFLGWYTEPDGGRLIDSNTPVTDDCPAVLYAHWQPLSFTVFFDPAGGSTAYGSKTVTIDMAYGELPVPVRDGYEFLGWFANDVTAFAVQPEWVVSAWQDFTLTARWAKLEEEAPEKRNTIQLWIDSPFLSVNGEVSTIDSEGTVPVIRNDRTLLPIRCVIEAMGGTVGWDGAARMVTLRLGDKSLYMIIGSTSVLDQSGTNHILDSAPVIINDRTMLPVRFVSEFFGAAVDWDGENRMVSITY